MFPINNNKPYRMTYKPYFMKEQKIKQHSRKTSNIINYTYQSQLEYNLPIINKQYYANLDMTIINVIESQLQIEQKEIPENFQLLKKQGYKKTKTLKKLEDLNSSFLVLSHTTNELIQYATLMLINTSYCSTIFTPKVTKKMVTMIAKNYNKIAYHNFSHAFYLSFLNYQCFQKQFRLRFVCNDEEYFYIIVAGLCHDINHNGKTNAFEIKIDSQLAKISKQQSVLQNMHIRHIWKILEQNPQFDFISPSNNKAKAKKIITRLILNTDMAFHSKSLQNFKTLKKSGKLDLKKNQEDKWTILEILFHACDIGNSYADYDEYINWCVLVSQQFNQIYEIQKKMNLSTAKSIYLPNPTSIYKDQLFFVGFLVIPLWKEIDQQFPHLKQISKKMQDNLDRVKMQIQLLKN